MGPVEIVKSIYWVGANDRTTELFEGLWPIFQEGVSYNAYLIKDEKTVLVDLVKDMKTDDFLDNVQKILPTLKLDYIVLNHLEPDHTGALNTIRRVAPNVTFLVSEKGKKLLKAFYGIEKNVSVVKDGDELSTGERTLKFFYTPFVHWPETIMTYEKNDCILFSCDAFGSYGALRGTIFDEDSVDLEFYKKEMLRYYSNIVATFSRQVIKTAEKLESVPIKIIAPSHGLVWKTHPSEPIKLYKRWATYSSIPSEEGITLLYASMYGNTEKAMYSVAKGIADTGVRVDIFDVTRTHLSYILPSLWQKRGVVIGAPTYEGSLFPPMVNVLEMAALKRVMHKKAFVFGSFGWSGGASRKIRQIVEPLRWEIVDVLEFNGRATAEVLQEAEKLGRKIASTVMS